MCNLPCNPACIFLQWFKEQGIVEKLVDFIHPTVDSKVHKYIKYSERDCIKISVYNVLLEKWCVLQEVRSNSLYCPG